MRYADTRINEVVQELRSNTNVSKDVLATTPIGMALANARPPPTLSSQAFRVHATTYRTATPHDATATRNKEQHRPDPTRVRRDGFLNRMERDIARREVSATHTVHTAHAAFKPSRSDAFLEVSLADGPVVKQHLRTATGLEPRRPYQWGPLGGIS